MGTRVTVADVAARAGTSKTTAHYVLAGRDQEMRISEDARTRVLRAAAELQYRPNLMARGLRTSSTQTIALITDSIATQQFASQLVYGALSAAAERGRLLLVCETGGDADLESRLLDGLLDRRVDGFLYATLYTQQVTVPPALVGVPLVLLNCLTADGSVRSVLPDEVGAGSGAARVLLDAGHRQGIWVVGEPAEHVLAGRERMAGMDREFAAAGVTVDRSLDCAWWPEPAYEAMDHALSTGGRPRAMVCLNDRIAMGAYQALAKHGLRIPDDVSVVSYDDSDLASWLVPQLTSVQLPHRELATRAVDLLLDDDPGAPRPQRVPMPVRVRSSVAPPRTGWPRA